MSARGALPNGVHLWSSDVWDATLGYPGEGPRLRQQGPRSEAAAALRRDRHAACVQRPSASVGIEHVVVWHVNLRGLRSSAAPSPNLLPVCGWLSMFQFRFFSMNHF